MRKVLMFVLSTFLMVVLLTACIPAVGQALPTPKSTDLPIQLAGSPTPLSQSPTQVSESPTQVTKPPVPTTQCTDAAQYVSDDGLDGTTYTPNTAFTKTWTLKNTGTCTWDSQYLVYQVSGELMTQQPGYWIVPQGQTVLPGQTVDISVGMTAPPSNGSYKAFWGLKNAAGQVIPVQDGADDNSFYVVLKVNDGTADGAVTATAIDIVQEQGSGSVCTAETTYLVHAYITTDGPATVSYEIGSSAGQISAGYFEDDAGRYSYITRTLHFDQAGKKAINLRFVGPYPYPTDITVMLRVDGGEWVSTKLPCQ